MKINIALTAVGLLILLSCSVSEQQHYYLGKIDSLQNELDSASVRYFKMDTVKIEQAISVINENLTRFGHIDTLTSDTVTIYSFIEKSLKKFDGERWQIMDEIGYSKNQLHTLKHDIRKKQLTEVQMKQYYRVEEQAVKNLLDRIWFNEQSIDYQLKSFDYLNDKIEKTLLRHEKKN